MMTAAIGTSTTSPQYEPSASGIPTRYKKRPHTSDAGHQRIRAGGDHPLLFRDLDPGRGEGVLPEDAQHSREPATIRASPAITTSTGTRDQPKRWSSAGTSNRPRNPIEANSMMIFWLVSCSAIGPPEAAPQQRRIVPGQIGGHDDRGARKYREEKPALPVAYRAWPTPKRNTPIATARKKSPSQAFTWRPDHVL